MGGRGPTSRGGAQALPGPTEIPGAWAFSAMHPLHLECSPGYGTCPSAEAEAKPQAPYSSETLGYRRRFEVGGEVGAGWRLAQGSPPPQPSRGQDCSVGCFCRSLASRLAPEAPGPRYSAYNSRREPNQV